MTSPLFFGHGGAMQVADIPVMTGAITANGQSLPFDVSRVSNVNMHCAGTFSSVTCLFEGGKVMGLENIPLWLDRYRIKRG